MRAYQIVTTRNIPNRNVIHSFRIVTHQLIRGRNEKHIRDMLGLGSDFEVILLSPEAIRANKVKPTLRDYVAWIFRPK